MTVLPIANRCLAGLLGLGLLVSCSRPRPAPAGRRPVILIVLDTLRADHLGYHGYERDTSPRLDRFARENVAFKRAFTAAPWTPPSVVTMLTGLYPSAHGHIPPNDRGEAKRNSKRLSPDLATLQKVLGRNGYRTAAVSPNPWIAPLFGFDEGFESFRYLHKETAGPITSAGIELVDGFVAREEPFFLYLHYFDPHDPYTPPESYAQMFTAPLERSAYPYKKSVQAPMARYDREIRHLDDELGRLFSHLQKSGVYDDAIIVVVADHGEQFLEHGRSHHGNALHNEEVHVPLIVRDPRSGRRAEVVNHVVSTVDIFPTILGQLGIRSSTEVHGLPLFARDALAARSGVLTEVRRITDQRGLISAKGRKAIYEVTLVPMDEQGKRRDLWQAPRLVGLFDLEADYFEQRPLEDGTSLARLRSELEAGFQQPSMTRAARAPAIPPGEMSEEALDQLKALGYLE